MLCVSAQRKAEYSPTKEGEQIQREKNKIKSRLQMLDPSHAATAYILRQIINQGVF